MEEHKRCPERTATTVFCNFGVRSSKVLSQFFRTRLFCIFYAVFRSGCRNTVTGIGVISGGK